MGIVKILYTYAAMMGAFLVVDLLWLGVFAKKFYKSQIGEFMKASPNWIAAGIFYALFIVGIMIFCVIPSVEKNSITHALIYGALFGFFTYMTYEMTNYAVIKNWPFTIVPVDILWGVVLTTIISAVGFYIAKI